MPERLECGWLLVRSPHFYNHGNKHNTRNSKYSSILRSLRTLRMIRKDLITFLLPMNKKQTKQLINLEFEKERTIWKSRGYWGMKKVKDNSIKRLNKLEERILTSLFKPNMK